MITWNSLQNYALVVVLAVVCSCSTRRPDTTGQGTVTEPPPVSLQVSDFEEIGGTNFLLASVGEMGGERGLSSGSYSDTRTRNVVFLDRVSLESHRLFETNQQIILVVEQLGRGSKQYPMTTTATTATTRPVKWLMFRVVSADTNHDDRLDAKDLYGLGVSDAFGLGYKEVVPNVGRVLAVSMIGEDQVMVAFESGGATQAARIDLPTRVVAASLPLTDVAGVQTAPAN